MNWTGAARTNYFVVKDAEAFCRRFGPGSSLDSEARIVTTNRADGTVLHGLLYDGGGIPSQDYVEDTDDEGDCGDWKDIDFCVELTTHLAEGEVAVIMEAGREGMRYVSGRAMAVNSAGFKVSVNLQDIYELVSVTMGVPVNSISKAEY